MLHLFGVLSDSLVPNGGVLKIGTAQRHSFRTMPNFWRWKRQSKRTELNPHRSVERGIRQRVPPPNLPACFIDSWFWVQCLSDPALHAPHSLLFFGTEMLEKHMCYCILWFSLLYVRVVNVSVTALPHLKGSKLWDLNRSECKLVCWILHLRITRGVSTGKKTNQVLFRTKPDCDLTGGQITPTVCLVNSHGEAVHRGPDSPLRSHPCYRPSTKCWGLSVVEEVIL